MKVTTPEINIQQAAVAAGGKISPAQTGTFSGATIDSRLIEKGMMFVALQGEKVDGADYIAHAIEAGAAVALAQRAPAGYEDKVILVEDTVAALGKMASWHRSQFDLKIAAITGSVGKTTTKDMIHTVLSQKHKTHKTAGNFNNHIGMPMTLLSIDESYTAAIYEMGMNHRGEISYLSTMARPDVAVITNIGTAHIENLGSREGIREAKLEIRDGLNPDGTLILNGDEPLLAGIDGALYVSMHSQDAKVYVSNIIEGERGSAFDLVIRGEKQESIVVPAFGLHNVNNAAMAYIVGVLFGLTDQQIRQGLMSFVPEGMRQNIYDYGDISIIEDCYNASAESMKASLATLAGYTKRRGGRSVAVLGEMRELGEFSAMLHSDVGRAAAEVGLGLLVTVGGEAEHIAVAACEAGMNPSAILTLNSGESAEEVAKIIAPLLKKTDRILFKASRALAFEEIIAELKEII
ncbi:MAG: UDP-N-acetylmuramoyl-tripeptide--D-alanyl-D-alanine ligase [Oscillospiraceae bacterium]|nr:UDP-N-acetylmuramoyl-tripeptide--D-alanyl-D-alanine ligase [Oscillospiraceae bacterium]